MLDSKYTDPEALRKLYRNPRNPLKDTEPIGVPDITPLEPPIEPPPPPDHPPIDFPPLELP